MGILAAVGRLLCLVAALCAVPAGLAGAAPQKAVAFRVASLTASARLSYSGEPVKDLERTSGSAVLTVRRAKGKAPKSDGSLGPNGGRIGLKLSLTIVENAKISQRSSQTTPYVEQRCTLSRTRAASGGLLLRKLSGSRIEVRWAFPHATSVSCPGPAGVGTSLVGRMVRVYPASRFAASRVSLLLSGTARFSRGGYTGSYTWRAAVVLVRA